MDNYIVYVGYIGEQCVYVGEGKPDRYQHLISGVSHVYKANEAHFKGIEVVVTTLESGLTKTKAVELEKEYIEKLKPIWNKREFVGSGSYPSGDLKRRIRRVFGINMSPSRQYQHDLCLYFCKALNSEGVAYIGTGQVERNGFKGKTMSELAANLNYIKVREIFDVVSLGKHKGYKVTIRESNK